MFVDLRHTPPRCLGVGFGPGGRLPLLPAQLLLPLPQLLLEPAVVLLHVAPEDRWQGVHPLQDLARLAVGVLCEAQKSPVPQDSVIKSEKEGL